MNKRTHVLLARQYMQGRLMSGELRALCVGTFLPDIGIMCFFRPHTYKRHKDRVVQLNQGVSKGGSGWWYWLKVGYIAHYIADFYTEPHNRGRFMQFCSHHRAYEADLHAYFLAHMWKIEKLSTQSIYSLEKRLSVVHGKYMMELGTVDVDFAYIVKEVCVYLEYCYGIAFKDK